VHARLPGSFPIASFFAAVCSATHAYHAERKRFYRLRQYGAAAVLDYHGAEWPTDARKLTGGEGVSAAINAARNGAKPALQAVRSGGRLATITSDPPPAERGITVSNVYVRPDGPKLSALAKLLAAGRLAAPIAAAYPIEDAGAALAAVVSGQTRGAIVLSTRHDDHE
jgi:NADPH:quinone reductase-like Zn-dependent oxidoreductase